MQSEADKMEYNYVKFPKKLLSKLNCDTYVVYSPSGDLNVGELKKQFNITSDSEMDVRTDKTIIDQTIIGEKLGRINPTRFNHMRIQLLIMKLPSDILIDDVIKFIPDSSCHDSYGPECLYYNIFKLHFNEDETYNIIR